MRKRSKAIVGLDIGSTRTYVVVGELLEEGITIAGIGTAPSNGIKKGIVVNLESTVESIKKAVEQAELAADCNIRSVILGVSGTHIKGQNSLGIIPVKGREIEEEDRDKAVEAAKAIAIPPDREIIHTVPQSYVVDGQDGIRNPIGMIGVRLEAKVHIITGSIASLQNIANAVMKAGLDLSTFILKPLAASEAVLTEEEKELGIAMIDIGGGSTNMAIFTEGCLRHIAILPIGGNFITSDLAQGLRTTLGEAERVKLEYGCARASMIPVDENIEIASMGGKEPRLVPRHLLGKIIEPRVEEIFRMVQREIMRSGFAADLKAGIVLTGGSSIMEGMPELAEDMFTLPVRRGSPSGLEGLVEERLAPAYATAVGTVLYGGRQLFREGVRSRSFIGEKLNRLTQFLSDLF